MKALDHQTFHSLEIDALYDELDGPSSSAIRDHAASCESCASRFERLRRTRQRGLSALAEAVPENFESRVMAAVDAALARRAGGPVLVTQAETQGAARQGGAPAPPQAAGRAGAGAKVIPFFARPSFQVAATLFLVVGAAAILSQMGMAKKAPSMASSDPSPAAAAASPAFPPEIAATTTAPFAGALAAGEGDNGGAKQPDLSAAPAVVAAAPGAPKAKPSILAAGEPPSEGKPAKAAMGRAGPAADPAFAAARALYDANRCAEALPRFEAQKATNPEADLYAARCIQKTRGCTAAAPRFDAVAQRNSGTELGSRARLEAGTCYQQIGQAQAARTRYQAAKDEGILGSEAASDLDALDQQAARPAGTTRAPAAAAAAVTTSTASPGTPGGARPASPKATAPVPADPLDNTRR